MIECRNPRSRLVVLAASLAWITSATAGSASGGGALIAEGL